MRSTFTTAAMLAALALALFGAWMHWAVLDPRNVGWLLTGEDRGQSAIGLSAYLRAGGPWPSLHEPLLMAPGGLPLLFTDSIPLIGLILKPLGVPAGWQFLGPWYLLCVALQVFFAWRLVRPYAPDHLAAFIGTVLLAAMPMLFNRYGHASLCAQWLVLWALYVFVDEERARRPGQWFAVLGVAALIHTYLLLMVAAFWGSAILCLMVRGPDRVRVLAGAGAVAAVIVAILWWHGIFAGPFGSTGTYGAFPMALDAWWNPANPGYTALIPSSAEDHGRGFEGLQYLGAGMLLLVAIAVYGWVFRRDASGTGRLLWLLPAFIVIAIAAIGPQPMWRGAPLFTLHLGPLLTNLLDPIRAAGRLAWPLTYTLAFAAIVTVIRLPRATMILAVALAVQVIDLTPMFAAVRSTSAKAADRTVYHRTLDPRWAALVARSSSVEFEPARPFIDLQLMEEITWRTVDACRPVRFTYASRESAATRARIDVDTADFAAGRLDPTRLYVLLDGKVPRIVAARVQKLDGITIIAPTTPAPPPVCR
ncbi:hypothetical protein FPZ24_03520 [Sphingomonas panacisoli]|uniref:Glycosyltransferase RgtA/B/C/D-like domain-containing protein n=1 Tax=Sphingomonas panacisoli TaxID=1813879 RepID=A0A5B8LES5_9SPHN|nr:DUF6311 domain-containing protein [Sphingomonas panacisoli]QDZ06657.1 hypothetical protein FPZ24_03520 [Sphingomonas panacisoli]